MNQTITVDNVDIDLLRTQRYFLLKEYKTGVRKEIDGLVNMLDDMLDIAEGYKV